MLDLLLLGVCFVAKSVVLLDQLTHFLVVLGDNFLLGLFLNKVKILALSIRHPCGQGIMVNTIQPVTSNIDDHNSRL